MGRLALAIGLDVLPAADLDSPPEWYLEALEAGAARFLRARGSLGLGDWGGLDAHERAAVAKVGDALDARMAVQVARALRSPEGEAEVLSLVDDGESLVGIALDEFLDRSGS